MYVPEKFGGVSPRGGDKQSGLKVHKAPFTSTLTSFDMYTSIILPRCPKDCYKKPLQ